MSTNISSPVIDTPYTRIANVSFTVDDRYDHIVAILMVTIV